MPELQQLDKSTLQLNDGFEDEQLENEDSNVEYNISVPDGIDGIPEGEDATIHENLLNIANNVSSASDASNSSNASFVRTFQFFVPKRN